MYHIQYAINENRPSQEWKQSAGINIGLNE